MLAITIKIYILDTLIRSNITLLVNNDVSAYNQWQSISAFCHHILHGLKLQSVYTSMAVIVSVDLQ